MQPDVPGTLVLIPCGGPSAPNPGASESEEPRTCRVEEVRVLARGEQRVRELAQPQLEHTRDVADVRRPLVRVEIHRVEVCRIRTRSASSIIRPGGTERASHDERTDTYLGRAAP